jgi:Family of unknown function (DUF6481)
MPSFKAPNFADRQQAAVKARQAALDKFKAKPGPGDPEFDRRQAERLKIEQERKVRQEAARIAKVKRDAEEKARLEAEAIAKKAAEEAEWLAKQAAEEAAELDAKAKRDARYAARKAAKKNGR